MIRAARSLGPRIAIAAAAAVALSSAATSASAYQRTLKYVTTGNGFGFQVYNADERRIVEFLEHPYRFLRPRSGQLQADGIIRRNLVWDVYFGVKGGGWLNAGTGPDPEYLDQTNIIHASITAGGVSTDSYYFAPYGYDGNAMVAVINAPSAASAYIMLNFHMGAGESQPGADGESFQAVAGGAGAVMETGPGGGAMIYLGLTGADHADCSNAYGKVAGGGDLGDNTGCSGSDQTLGLQKDLTDGWWAVGMQYIDDTSKAQETADGFKAWANGRGGQQILDDAKTEFETWRVKPPEAIQLGDEERKVWRQSETVLRMGQVREPNTNERRNHGMMLASLPHGEWHSGWVRDGMYAIVALARSGHAKETKDALDFLLNAAPVSGKYSNWFSIPSYRISTVRYFGTGEEDADFSGQSTPNIEVDGWGMMMWAARQYVDATGDIEWLNSKTSLQPDKTVYQVLVEGVANPLESYLEPTGIVKKDSSIWEVHQGNARHFAYTTLAAARGFCDMAALARRAGNDADAEKYKTLSGTVVGGFGSYFKDANNAFVGSGSGEGKTAARIDASVVEVFTWNIVKDYTKPYVAPTFGVLDQLKVVSGGYKRNDEGQSSYDNHEWILVDLRMSDALRRRGDADSIGRADELVKTIVDKAAVNFYLIPELYSAVSSDAPIGSYHGSIPMVGYGAGAFILTMFDRQQMYEPNDCGTELPPVTDGGGTGGTGQGGSGPGQGGSAAGGGGAGGCDDPLTCGGNNESDTSEIPRKAACLCGLDTSAAGGAEWLSLGLLPLALVARRRRAKPSR
jgi:GH15 family glucan-1,4-alpha-glucosidase